MFKIKIQHLIKLSLVLLADINQAQFVCSNLKQIIENQNDEISQLKNKAVKLQTANEMLVDTNIEVLVKDEMIKKHSRLRDIK